MHKIVHIAAATGLIAAQVAATAPALAQPAAMPPAAAQAKDKFGRPITKPAPIVRPEPGFGGGNSGGQQGGNGGGGPGFGGGSSGGQQGGNGGGGGPGFGGGSNWGSTVRCESRNYRLQECRADTRGGVRLVRQLGGNCRQGATWGTRPGIIWVNNGCRAEFQTRYGGGNGGGNGGGYYPPEKNGPSTGAIIGGVAVAAGLIALIAATQKNPQNASTSAPTSTAPVPYQPPAGTTGQPARITADLGGLTTDARPSFNTCLTEAARQIGATGGTEVRLDRFNEVEKGNGGYRFRFMLVGVYPDESRTIPMYCRATPDKIIELTFG